LKCRLEQATLEGENARLLIAQMGEAPGDVDALVEKVRIILANSAHLERLINEEFHRFRRVKLNQEENVVSVNANGLSASFVEPSVDFDSAVELVSNILDRLNLPFDLGKVQGWVAGACATFTHIRVEADNITFSRVLFILDWVLKCLADSLLRLYPHKYYNRQFLIGFRHPTSIADSGLQLTGPVAHGIFGTIWLHAKLKRSADERHTPNSQIRQSQRVQECRDSIDSNLVRRGSAGDVHSRSSSADVSSDTTDNAHLHMAPSTPSHLHRAKAKHRGSRLSFARVVQACPLRGQFVVVSISKSFCKLPPEIMSNLIHDMIEMEPVPHVLPLLDAYEDLEHIHLVYAPLSTNSICMVDHIFDLMHLNSEERDIAQSGFCEHDVQSLIWRLMSMIKMAHGRSLVHATLRMGGVYLDDPESIESMRVLEFGLYKLFHIPQSIPPLSIMTPLDLDATDPVPPYRRDFQCVAEIMYLLMGGQPICSLDCSLEYRRQRFRCGAASFADKVYSRTSEPAKTFLLELMKPAQFQKHLKIPLCHMATLHLTHRWFFPPPELVRELDETFDMVVMRKFDTWRNTLRLQTNLVKLVADRMTLASLSRLRQDLKQVADDAGRVSWTDLRLNLQQLCLVPADLLKKVNKAYGDNVRAPSIHVDDFWTSANAWRQKRVREVLWQIFSRSKCFHGTISSEACLDGLTSGVIYIWSWPARVIDIVFPLQQKADIESENKAKLNVLIGSSKQISFQDLVVKTDAAAAVLSTLPELSQN
jgi:hypothetical protein